MGRLKSLLILSIITLSYISSNASGYVQFNFDYKTLAQLEANILGQTAANELQNAEVDSILGKHVRLAAIVTGILGERQLLVSSCQNVKSFKEESGYYKRIAKLASEIITESEKAVSSVCKSNLTQKANALLQIGNFVTKAVGCGNVFYKIATNAKVKNPFNEYSGQYQNNNKEKKNDGYNLLDRRKRLTLVNQIIAQLADIKHSITRIRWAADFSTAVDVCRNIDRTGYIKGLALEYKMNEIIGQWKQLKK